MTADRRHYRSFLLAVLSQCSEKGLTYECQILGGVSDYYLGDDTKIRQVLINILSNAIKFTDPPGSVLLTVEPERLYQALEEFIWAAEA